MIPTAPAVADDEGSEHSAKLVGAETDTLGVTVRFDDKAGWSMAIRAKPGAAERASKLPLPTHHAHYVVHVAPGHTAITFVEVSTGVTKARMQPRAADRLHGCSHRAAASSSSGATARCSRPPSSRTSIVPSAMSCGPPAIR